jgi:hypothetical protein
LAGVLNALAIIFGYAFSKALISTVRGSGVEVVIGLARQTRLPLVAEPLALDVPVLGEPDEPLPPVLLLLPHAVRASADAIPNAVSSTALERPNR